MGDTVLAGRRGRRPLRIFYQGRRVGADGERCGAQRNECPWGIRPRGVSRFRARVTFGRCPKSDQKDSQKPRFLDFLRAVSFANLRHFTTRSREMVVIVAYDASPILLAPLPLTLSTVELIALFGVGISGSGAGAETILINETKKEFLRNRVVKTRKLV